MHFNKETSSVLRLVSVEALLDELDSAVAPTPAPVVQTRPLAGRAGLSGEGALPSKTGKIQLAVIIFWLVH